MFVVLKKTALIACLVAVLCLTALCVGLRATGGAAVYFGKTERLVPIYRVDTDCGKVALTFDAAWGSDSTLGILSVLEEYNVPATFFLVQFWAEKYPDLVKKIDAQGIEIGTHSATHPHMPKLSEAKIRVELESSMKALQQITGKTPTVFRPPYGDYDNKLLTTASALGLKTIQWDVDSLDWKGLSAAEIATRVVSNAKSGSIILMHNDGEHTLEALPLIIEGLTNKGLGCCSVGELVYKDNYYIDAAGVQHTSAPATAQTAAI